MKVQPFRVVLTPDSGGRMDSDVRIAIATHLRACAGVATEIVIKPYKSKRSLDQNAYWWAVPVAILAEHCGYEPEQMHYALLGEWRGYMEGIGGQKIPNCASSSKLTTAEFTQLIEWVQRWAATEMDVQIPSPNEVAA